MYSVPTTYPLWPVVPMVCLRLLFFKKPRQDWITNQAVVWDKCMVLAAQALSYGKWQQRQCPCDDISYRYSESFVTPKAIH